MYYNIILKIKNFFLFLIISQVPYLKVEGQVNSPLLLEIPSWVKMMSDPNANYFKAVLSFDVIWKNRKIPQEDLKNANFSEGHERVMLTCSCK